MLLSFVFLFFALFTPLWAAPHVLTPIKRHQGRKTGQLLVTFKPTNETANGPTILGVPSAKAKSWGARLAENSSYYGWTTMNGFSAYIDKATLRDLQASPDVLSIEEDGIMQVSQTTTQTNARWGLGRLSQADRLVNQNAAAQAFSYTFPSTAGAGTDIYIVDTGVRTTHSEFGNRARTLNAIPALGTSDGNGHGTHCAGTAAGQKFGVAKAANIIGVKVLADNGSGSNSNIIKGIEASVLAARASGRPSVINMSLGGRQSNAIDNAVAQAVAAGVHVVVAAGNETQDARLTSPGGSPVVVSVGASDIADRQASFSNFGPAVTLFAPGVSIRSAGITSNTAEEVLSGTSMASPHVAGLIATIIADSGNVAPAAMKTKLTTLGVQNGLRNVRGTGTPTVLANVG